jgi:hypothetical protein
MPNNGTGCPLTLRCAKCKRGRDWRYDEGKAVHLEATGRQRPLTKKQVGHWQPRQLRYRLEYRCRDCGHVGWSRHATMLRLLKKKEAGP